MEIHRCSFDERFVAFCWVFAGAVAEETTAEGLTDFLRVSPAGCDGMFVAFHDFYQLIPDVLCATHRARLNEILKTPRISEFVLLPAVIRIEKCQVIAVWVMEFSFLLVGLGLFFFWAVKDVRDGKHGYYGEDFFRAAEVHCRD